MGDKIIILETYLNEEGKISQKTTTIPKNQQHKHQFQKDARVDVFEDVKSLTNLREVSKLMHTLSNSLQTTPQDFLEKVGVELLIELKRELKF